MKAPAPNHHPDSLTHAHALSVRHYFGEASLAVERRSVFGRTWQMVGQQQQVADPGDHIVEDVAGTPVLVLRGRDGVLRAFPNVCRHRAGPLALCSGKGMHTVRCRYHGWLYSQEGQLIGAPEMQDAADFRIEDIRLPALRIREWQGLVFVALHDDAPDFDEVIGGIAERIAPVELAAMRFARRDVFDIACNWKVYIDNFLEGYHLPVVHPGLAKVLDYRAYETELCGWHSVQHSPLRDNDGSYGDGEAYYFFVYPNICFNVMPGRLQTNRILPLGADNCRVEFDYYYAQDPQAQARIGKDQVVSDEIQDEDMRICEAVQKGLKSGFYDAGRLSPRRESGVWHFHEHLRAAYAHDAARPAAPR